MFFFSFSFFFSVVEESNVREEAHCWIYCSATVKDLWVGFIGLPV